MITNEYSKIAKIDGSFSTPTTGIDLGVGWTINGMRNLNDKYLAIAGSSGNFNNNYLFLWDGVSSRYNYSTKMAGKYIDMKVVEGVLYVAIWVIGSGNGSPGKTVIYYLKGTQLVPVITPQISRMTQQGDKGGFVNIGNRIGLNLDSKDLLLYGKSEVGTEEFVLSNGIQFFKFSETYNGYALGGVGTSLYWYDYTSTTFNQILYKTQWIPIQNLSRIDVFYDTPPQLGTDAINLTIYGKGENIASGNSTTTLQSITPTNYLNKTRTSLDVLGFTGDKIMITLATTNSGTWRPIIRQLDLITQ